MISTSVRRLGVVAAGTTAAIALAAGSASAFHCYVPTYSLNGPVSAQWDFLNVGDAAGAIAGYTAECDGAVEAGYDALREARLPLGIKVNMARIVGDPQFDGVNNPNGANGKGLEYFEEGSTLADDMLSTWIAGADAYTC